MFLDSTFSNSPSLSVVAEGVVDFAGVALQAEGQEERGPQQQGALQDAARHLHGDQGGHNDGYDVRQHNHL